MRMADELLRRWHQWEAEAWVRLLRRVHQHSFQAWLRLAASDLALNAHRIAHGEMLQ